MALSVEADKFDAKPGGEIEVKVTCVRRDYAGPISLSVEGLKPALAAAIGMVLVWRNFMYSLIWQSVIWRPGKGRIPHWREDIQILSRSATTARRCGPDGSHRRRSRSPEEEATAASHLILIADQLPP